MPPSPLSFWPGLRVAPRVTKLLFVGFADGHHVRGGGVSGRQELAATHEDLRDLHNGEPRRVSRFVAFFRPTILVTRRRDHFVAALKERFSLHNFTASITATRSQMQRVQIWIITDMNVAKM